MDELQIDRLARILGMPTARRSAVGILAALGLVSAPEVDSKRRKPRKHVASEKKKKKKKSNKRKDKDKDSVQTPPPPTSPDPSDSVLGVTSPPPGQCPPNPQFTGITWPFKPESGQWAIISGYRGGVDHCAAARECSSPNASQLYGLDFAKCLANKVDLETGTCTDVHPWARTTGDVVLAPVSGKVIWRCPPAVTGQVIPIVGIGIEVAGAPGHVVSLIHADGLPGVGSCVVKGEPIGTVSDGNCGAGIGNHIHLSIYKNNATRDAVSFTGQWAIDGCSYDVFESDVPDDPRLFDQHLGQLIPCGARCSDGILVEVDARQEWQTTPINWKTGEWHLFEVIGGLWTHWQGGRPYNAGTGEDFICADHFPIDQCFEPLPTFNHGGLIGRLANQLGQWGEAEGIGNRSIEPTECTGSGCGQVYANTLGLRINDTFLADNDGTLLVCVSKVPAETRRNKQGRGLIVPAVEDADRANHAGSQSPAIGPTPTPTAG